ncbi:hypothetical protein THASP1DRAFT_28518 [Thamnocephalis sphaerospora]|uniref:Uncharacterized protein n=1 Tax=Thamnocephalis sphaerospora TaxID=78915 RepID=A0A4V1IX36_9FUNG|nr:hypothetical protein THASP1DRAFT_28518 [Thamnocephalis sphaerospora]|eukprot:RKP09689.1 hypothetical protein THASP1DRAFT_28518 [Thamnocephalis sphaerospora]
MRLAFLFKAAAAAALVGLTLVDLPVFALSTSPPSYSSTLLTLSARPRPRSQPSPVSSADIALLTEYSNSHIQIFPRFAVLQPHGTRPIYRRDGRNRTTSIDFAGAGEAIVRKVGLTWIEFPDRIYMLTITDFPHGRSESAPREQYSGSTYIGFGYDANCEKILSYKISTTIGTTSCKVENSSEIGNIDVELQPAGRHFMLRRVQPWNGTSISLAPGPRITNGRRPF